MRFKSKYCTCYIVLLGIVSLSHMLTRQTCTNSIMHLWSSDPPSNDNLYHLLISLGQTLHPAHDLRRNQLQSGQAELMSEDVTRSQYPQTKLRQLTSHKTPRHCCSQTTLRHCCSSRGETRLLVSVPTTWGNPKSFGVSKHIFQQLSLFLQVSNHCIWLCSCTWWVKCQRRQQTCSRTSHTKQPNRVVFDAATVPMHQVAFRTRLPSNLLQPFALPRILAEQCNT